jgi:uncharacterized protein (DUF488 family)
MSTIYTIGHSTKPIEDFIELLQSAGVTLLVDVRRYPGSRRHPQFNREALAASLLAVGIDYQHTPSLGGRRTADQESVNTFWRSASFRGYADHMASAEFQGALQNLEHAAENRAVAVMCAESVPWHCHRQMIADALVARGHAVRHILTTKRFDLHELNSAAVAGEDGQLTYPAPAAQQATEQVSLFD